MIEDRTTQAGGHAADPECAPTAPTPPVAVGEVPGSAATAAHREQVHVSYNDAPVHCIDVRNTRGQRAMRIRPQAGGATFTFDDVGPVYLTAKQLGALVYALDHLPGVNA